MNAQSRAGRLVRATGIAAIAAAALLLTGCAAGQRAQTAVESPVVDGVFANVGKINIRAASVSPPTGNFYPVGSNAKLNLVLINNGGTDDILTSVTAVLPANGKPAASSVVFYANAAAAKPSQAATSVTPSGAVTTSSSAPGSASTSPTPASPTLASPTPAAPATASPTPAATPTATPEDGIKIAAGGTVQVGLSDDSPIIALVGLTDKLYPATSITVTFTFANNGSTTFTLAVHLTTGAVSAPSLEVTHPEDN